MASNRFRRIYIEISNICNLKCSFCPEVERESKVMDIDFFRKTMVEVSPLTDEVCLHLMGEPLGHPHLKSIIAICSEFKTPVNLTTNGMLLHGERTSIVMDPIVRQINVSVHSFEANFHGRDVTPYMKRLFSFTNEAISSRPDLFINYRLWDLADPQTLSPENARIRELIEHEFQVDLKTLKVDLRRKKGHQLRGRVYLNFDSRFEWPALSLPIRSKEGTCYGLSNHIGIHADGSVVPCCLDKEAMLKIGDIKTESLANILTGERASSIRNGFRSHQLVEDLCQRCTFISRFDRKVRRKAASPKKSQIL